PPLRAELSVADDRFVLTGPLDPGTRADGPLDAGTTAAQASAASADDRRVIVHEVGPRDGLQAEPTALDAQVKIDFATALLAAGVTSLEVASFVHPARAPQMADAQAVAGSFPARDGLRLLSLVPNRRRLDRQLAAGSRHLRGLPPLTAALAQ